MKLKDLLHNIFIKSLFYWFLFIPVPVVNGIFRENYLKLFINDLAAHWISTLILSAALLMYFVAILGNNLKYLKAKTLISIGIIWVGMTIIFEFGFGHYVDGVPWKRLFNDYNLSEGRIWPLFLLLMLLAPLLAQKIKKNL